MKNLSEFIPPHIKHYDSYEEFCINENKESSVETEREYLSYKYFKYSSCDIYPEIIYERLGESLSLSYLYSKLAAKFPQTALHATVAYRNKDVAIKFKAKGGFVNNPHFSQLLHSCNWFISNMKQEQDDYLYNLTTYTVEPKKPTNYTDYIYNQCNGVIYRIVKENKLGKIDRILKYGLKPIKTFDVEDEDNYRTYLAANVSEEAVRSDLAGIIDEIDEFNVCRDRLRVLRMDLKVMRKNTGRTIQLFIDPRMETKCYWTADFILPSCITNVTDKFKDVLNP